MRRERKPSPVRGLLLFLLGVLVGANLVYFLTSRESGVREAPAADDDGRVEMPLPIHGAGTSASPTPATGVTTTPTRPPVLPSPAVVARGTGPAAATALADAGAPLLIPVQGVVAAQLQDTFSDARGEGRRHDAIDIMAPAGTPVLAVADGTVEKLFDSKQGGLTLYQFDPERTQAWYYAHLQDYAPGIAEKKTLRRGEVIGYVGATGNASPEAPHLHFAIFRLGPERQWWKGEAVNPYPLLGGGPR